MGLEELRASISEIDRTIVSLFLQGEEKNSERIRQLVNRRYEFALEIGKFKIEQRVDVYDAKQEERKCRELRDYAREFHIDEKRVIEYFLPIIAHSREIQEELMANARR